MDTMTSWSYTATQQMEDPYQQIMPIIQDLSYNFRNKTEQEQDAVVDQIVKEIRKINIFPIIYFNEDGINTEIQSVIKKNDVSLINHEISTHSSQGLLLLDFLFPNLHYATTCNEKKSMYDRFYNDSILKQCIKKYLLISKSINNLRTVFFSTARFYYDTPINFSPIRAKVIFESFCPEGGTIYDYSAGYGGRMLGALCSHKNFTYIATDPNTDTYHNLQKLGEYIEKNTGRTDSYQLYNIGSENLQLEKESIDFAFSCPPFFNKEIYTSERTQSIVQYPYYKDWINIYVRLTLRNCFNALKPEGIYGVDVLNYFLSGEEVPITEDWLNIAKEEGFYLKDKIPIVSRYRKKDENNTEVIYLFMKDKNAKLHNSVDQETLLKAIEAAELRKQRAFRRGNMTIAEYDINGILTQMYHSYDEISIEKNILKSKKLYNNTYYRIYYGDDVIEEQIEVKKPICKIDNEYFFSQSDIGRYLNVSRQAVSQAKQRKSMNIANKDIQWLI